MANITRDIDNVSSRPVGHGGFSDIYTGIWSSPGGELKVAIKVVRASPNDLVVQKVRRRLEKEMRVWGGLSHPNVQELCGIYEGIGSLPALVSPWCKNGNIKTFVHRQTYDPRVSTTELERTKLNLLIDVISGVQFLHDNRIVHGDIKADNILISDRGAPLVCDFGLSRMIADLSESTTQTGPRGTWRWMAPELCLVDGARPSYATDVWACGCLFIEVWCSMLPYHSKANQQQFFLAVNAGEGPCTARPVNMPNFVWAQVQECCNFDASQRPPPSHVRQLLTDRMPSPTAKLRLSIDVRVGTGARSVAWFPDGIRVAVGCSGGSTLILNLVTGVTLRRLVGHTGDTSAVVVSRNGRLVASCSEDIRLWDAETGLAIGAPMVGHAKRVSSVAFSSDARHIVSGSRDNTIRVWSTETSTSVLGPLRGYTGSIYSVAYSPDGSHIVSGSWDHTVRVRDARTGYPIMTLRGHTDAVLSVAYSPNGLHIVSGAFDDTVRIWDATTGQQIGSPLEGHSDFVRSVAYSPDGTRIASGSDDNTIRIWDAASRACTARIWGHTDKVFSVAFSPDGQRLASASEDGTIRVWHATDNWRR